MTYDIAIFGGGIAGFHCAIAAARMGAKVILLEGSGTLGGLATLGLVNPFMQYHLNQEDLVKGIFSELIQRMKTLHGYSKDTFDSEIMRIVMHQMIENEENIDCLFHTTPFFVKSGQLMIQEVQVISSFGEKLTIIAKCFVDCTGNGALSRLADATTCSGNEQNENQAMSSLFVIGGVNFEAIRRDVRSNKENFFKWVNPNLDLVMCAGYFDEVERAKKEGLDFPNAYFFYIQLPGNGRVTVNTTHVHESSDNARSVSRSIHEGIKQCQIVHQFAKEYVPGFEQSYIEKIAPQIGIRENRRVKGQYTFSGDDVISFNKFEDGIVKGCYGVDVHKKDATVNDEEKETIHRYSDYYEIPLRVLISEEFKNLYFAGRCFSADFQGHSAGRIIPTCAGMGQGLGVFLSYYDGIQASFEKNQFNHILESIVQSL